MPDATNRLGLDKLVHKHPVTSLLHSIRHEVVTCVGGRSPTVVTGRDHQWLTCVIWKTDGQRRVLDLLFKEILLVEKHYDRRLRKPLVVTDRIKQLQALMQTILCRQHTAQQPIVTFCQICLYLCIHECTHTYTYPYTHLMYTNTHKQHTHTILQMHILSPCAIGSWNSGDHQGTLSPLIGGAPACKHWLCTVSFLSIFFAK